MMFFWLILLVPLAIYVIADPRADAHHAGAEPAALPQGTAPAPEDPMAIARRRLASGEIASSEYEEIRRRLIG